MPKSEHCKAKQADPFPNAGCTSTVPPTWQTVLMADVDMAKLKCLRAPVSSALDRVPEKSAHGLPPTYNTLRGQVIEAIPEGLRRELEAIAAEIVRRAKASRPSSMPPGTERSPTATWLRSKAGSTQ